MKAFKSTLIKTKIYFNGVHLVDKCLIAFMFILLLQSAYTLFFYASLPREGDSFDIIVRTVSASIFGYFLSANFIKSSKSKAVVTKASFSATKKSDSFGEAVEVFAPADLTSKPIAKPADTKSDSYNSSQVIAAAAIGLFCLIVLIILRNISAWEITGDIPSTVSATVGQFRDFVLGCVGFLIGSPTKRSE